MREQDKEPLTGSFGEQGGIATSNPSRLRRWLTSKMMTRLSGQKLQQKTRLRAERKRQKMGLPHQIEYFHQVDDGYSHLAVQLLSKLVDKYDIQLKCHLVIAEHGDNTPEPDLLKNLSRYDAQLVAPHYGLNFPNAEQAPGSDERSKATMILANMSNEDFTAHAQQVSQAFWQADSIMLEILANIFGQATAQATQLSIANGNARRAQLKHYSGAMFFYGDEWYWGVDRFYHLEKRLIDLQLDRTKTQALIAPRPKLISESLKGADKLSLEIYPSLRSPYSAIAFDQTVVLAKAIGVKLKVLPVLPMVMRGVPATVEKGKYILFDAGREARAAGISFGPCADPIGKPVIQGYALCHWAEQQGKLVEFFSAFLKCAWVEATDTSKLKGLKRAVEKAGLDWSEAQTQIDSEAWKNQLEENRLSLYQAGLWGVPSFRLLDESGKVLLEVWGQDRLWLLANKVEEVLNKETK